MPRTSFCKPIHTTVAARTLIAALAWGSLHACTELAVEASHGQDTERAASGDETLPATPRVATPTPDPSAPLLVCEGPNEGFIGVCDDAFVLRPKCEARFARACTAEGGRLVPAREATQAERDMPYCDEGAPATQHCVREGAPNCVTFGADWACVRPQLSLAVTR